MLNVVKIEHQIVISEKKNTKHSQCVCNTTGIYTLSSKLSEEDEKL